MPNAIPLTARSAWLPTAAAPGSAGLRLRYLGAYALEETGEQKSAAFWMASLKAGYRITPKLQITLDVLNLFDKKANDIECWGGACTRNEAMAGTGGCGTGTAIDGRLVHPLEPRTFRSGCAPVSDPLSSDPPITHPRHHARLSPPPHRRPASGQGKTTVTAALARLHARQGGGSPSSSAGPDFSTRRSTPSPPLPEPRPRHVR